jgi:Rrf2 family protein
MDLIRRDTDYALRLAAQLAKVCGTGRPMSARVLAKDNHVSYSLTCKLLQKLAAAGLVNSTMGPKGGFLLARRPESITFGQVIEAVQGPVSVIRCLMGDFKCPMKGSCPASPKLKEMQQQINGFLNDVTLAEFVKTKGVTTHG